MGGPALGLEEANAGDFGGRVGCGPAFLAQMGSQPHRTLAFRRKLSVGYGDVRVAFPPASFLQATNESEHEMIAFAQNAAGKGKAVLDLFSGLGGFGLSISKAKKRLFADVDGPSTQALTHAVRGLANAEVQTRNLIGDPFRTSECNEFDTVIFDPPRGGA